MDLNSLKDQVSNLTLYDIKAGVRKVQNAVMNYTEMESKVREATNNEPWGASPSMMQEIANGTHSYQLLNEIMPLIYKRFTDKTAEEWRQIYKSLQLLEFLVKNGSERVVDDARQHLSLLRMLRQFHYMDQNGKDQGVNVRNRAQELAKLLGDIDAIRAERKKARANKNKYGGVEGGLGMGGGMSSGSRYGGFGSEDVGYGGYRGEVYGDGGGYGGNTSTFQDTQRRGDQFEEYDEEENGGALAAKSTTAARPRASSNLRAASLNTIKRDAKVQKEPEQDLFDFGDEPGSASNANNKTLMDSPKAAGEFGVMQSAPPGDDDFDDFQSATTPGVVTEAQRSAFSGLASPPPARATSTVMASTPVVAPQPVAPAQTSNINELFASISPPLSSGKPMATSTPSMPMTSSVSSPSSSYANKSSMTTSHVSTGPNYYTSVPSTINKPSTPSVNPHLNPLTSPNQSFPTSVAASSFGKPASNQSASNTTGSGDAFGSLWSTASGKAGIQNKSTGGPGSKGPDLASMAKAKNEAAMWGPSPSSVGAAVGSGGDGAGMSSIPTRPHAPTPRTASKQAASQPGGLGGAMDDLLG